MEVGRSGRANFQDKIKGSRAAGIVFKRITKRKSLGPHSFLCCNHIFFRPSKKQAASSHVLTFLHPALAHFNRKLLINSFLRHIFIFSEIRGQYLRMILAPFYDGPRSIDFESAENGFPWQRERHFIL